MALVFGGGILVVYPFWVRMKLSEIVSVAVNLLFMSVIRFITKIYWKRNSIRKFIARSDIRPHAFPANEFICSSKHVSLQLNSFVLAHSHLSVMDVLDKWNEYISIILQYSSYA